MKNPIFLSLKGVQKSGIFIVATIFFSSCSSDREAAQSMEDELLQSDEQKISYMLGYSLANQIKSAGMDVDISAVNTAISDVKGKKALALSPKQMHLAGSMFQNLSREKKLADARAENVEFGRQFFLENASAEGVQVSEKGVQYKVIVSGEGETASDKAYYTIRYKGTLLDGTVFEDSHSESVSFYLDQVIPAWGEVLPLMKKGAHWKIWAPYHLAYPNGTQTIPPGSALVFDIELIDVSE